MAALCAATSPGAHLRALALLIVDARGGEVTLLVEFPLRSSNGALNGSLTRLNQGLEESVER